MTTPTYRELGSSVTTTIDNKNRKVLLVPPKELYSQKLDLSDFIGMDPETSKAITSVPYEIRDKSGTTLLRGKTDENGETERIFTREKTDLQLYVGEGGWKLSADSVHDNGIAAVEVQPKVFDSEKPATRPLDTQPSPQQGVTKESSPVPENPLAQTPSPQAGSEPKDQSQLDLTVNDWKGFPIPNLPIKILVGKQEIFVGPTDAKGQVSVTLNEGDRFEIQVKRDRPRVDAAGKSHEYNLGAISVMSSREVQAGLQSKSMKFDFCTEAHAGAPGGAEAKKKATIKSHNQKPETTPVITGNPSKKPTIAVDRDEQGLPTGSIGDGLKDWLGRNGLNVGAPASGQADVDKVKKLIDFAEKQATWRHEERMTSSAIVTQMINRTFVIPPTKPKDRYTSSIQRCNKYVKIALWFAGYGPATGVIGDSVSPARLMGPELERAGFRNITAQLPDARWAAPGDIIVYERTDNPTRDGHIDIRTYDGYISDFFETYLPVSRFTVIGIYRKYYDPEPALRVRAFLMVIASREAENIFKTKGYEATYSALPGQGQFTSFATHPFADKDSKNTPSGAYGIIKKTWHDYLPFLKLPENADLFTPTVQDRIAITIMEQTKNALGLVRKGEIVAAAELLTKADQIAALPGHKQSRGYTNAEMMASYEEFLARLKKGK